MPFAYLTLLKPPHASNPETGRRPSSESLVSLHDEITSTTGVSNGELAAESSESELEVLSPRMLGPGDHPAHNNGQPELECGLNQVNRANKGLAVQNNIGGNGRPVSRKAERGAKRTKYRRRHGSLRQGLRLRRTEVTDPLNSGLRQTELEAETLSPATETCTIEEGINASVGDHSQLVSAWMNNPEIVSMSQTQALVMHRQPRQELLSYLDLIASIGTVDVVRSFAVGVTQLLCHTRLSYEVPAPPNHLQDIEDADAMQCFWRAAYRSQVSASLVSFGVILHRRSLATLRYCYFKAINSIKCTRQRKGQPGHTKTAIARSILLDTVFPGSDKLVSAFL